MQKITPQLPSFVHNYWRPWNENSSFNNSYLDYCKDVSLTKFGADMVGKYISEASSDQINAINNLGQKVGLGMNIISNQLEGMSRTMENINNEMQEMNSELRVISNLHQNSHLP